MSRRKPLAWLCSTRESVSVTLYEDQAYGDVTPLFAEDIAILMDAKRYQWLREAEKPMGSNRMYKLRNLYGHHLDNAIDAAIAAQES